jgi:hypothetical protein
MDRAKCTVTVYDPVVCISGSLRYIQHKEVEIDSYAKACKFVLDRD